MHGSSARIAFLVCLTLAGAVRPLAAQGHLASIRGVVVDPALAGVSRVDVRATREETRESRRVRTDDRGRFTVSQLPPGTYRVEVEHPGYGPFLARIALITNQEFRLDIELQPGSVLHATDVPAPFSPVDQASPALNTFVDIRELTGIPLEAGNFLELALLGPGTVRTAAGGLAINGARGDANGFLLDGVANFDPRSNAPAVRPPVDGIRDVQVLTSTYDATFGRNAGGQINVVTRSGTSRLTGSAYEFYRGGALSARNRFAPADGPAPDYSRHQLGGSVGGPIVPERTFFFADYERTRLRQGVTRIATVPTAAERMGNFSASVHGRPVNRLTDAAFAGGQVPSALQSPAGRALAALYPLPNRDGASGNYLASPVRRVDDDRVDLRVDNAFTGGARLTGRYSGGDSRRFEPFAGAGAAVVPGYGAAMPRRAQNAGLSFTHAPRRSIANDVRFGYTYVADGVASPDTGVSSLLAGSGITVVSVAGLSPLGVVVPPRHASDTFQLSDAATWARGTHLLKFGGEWYGVRQRASGGVRPLGQAAFELGGPTGNAVADLLLGLPALTAAVRSDTPQTLRSRSWGLFAQDNWRASDSLTLTAGVRYEVDAPAVDAGSRASLYDPAAGAVVRLGTAGVPRGGYAADRNNVAPRAGFSWVLDRERKNLLRGGYGVYFNQTGLAASEPIYLNPPYSTVDVRASDGAALMLAEAFSSGRLLPPSVIAYQRDLQTPWMEHWNVNVQHQVGQTRSLEVGYAGSRGHDLLAARALEPHTPAIGAITLLESRAPATTPSRSATRSGRLTGCRCWRPTRSASPPTMPRSCSRVQQIRTCRARISIREPTGRGRRSTSAIASRPPSCGRSRSAAAARCSGRWAGSATRSATSSSQWWQTSRPGAPSRPRFVPIPPAPPGRFRASAATGARTSAATRPSRRRRPIGGSTPAPSRCRRRAPPATAAATLSKVRATATSASRWSNGSSSCSRARSSSPRGLQRPRPDQLRSARRGVRLADLWPDPLGRQPAAGPARGPRGILIQGMR